MRKSFHRASLVLAASVLALASAARAEVGAVAAPRSDSTADAGGAVEAVIVTGLRGSQRTVATSPAPIDVLDAKQLDYTGRAEFSEALSRLLPSVNFGANQAGINSIVRPITNRGLGPAYTLVLVNGKRRHTDLDVTISVNDRARVAIGASNLFDVRPETNGVGSPQSGAGYYGPSPYAPSGGFYDTRLSLDF